jgi:hypothetical protein
MFDDGPIPMAPKSKDPSQVARLPYDSNHNTTHYNDPSNWRFPELSTACFEIQYELNTTKSKMQLIIPSINFDEKFQKPVQLLNFAPNGALPELGHSAGMHIIPAYKDKLCIPSPLTNPSQVQRCPVHNMIEDPCRLASLSPYYKASHTIAQDMFTLHLSLSLPDDRPGETEKLELENLPKPDELFDVTDEIHDEDLEHQPKKDIPVTGLLLQGDEN